MKNVLGYDDPEQPQANDDGTLSVSNPEPPQPKATGIDPTWKSALTSAYQQYLGRTPGSDDELTPHLSNPGGLSGAISAIQNSDEAKAYAARQAGQGGNNGQSNDLMSRITAALGAAQSTDDPNYWYGKISADPNGAGSAWNWWVDRINRGDGALAVRNGSVQRFNDGPSNNTTVGNNSITQNGPATGFADPAYQNLVDLATQRINALSRPQSFPQLDSLMSMLRDNQAAVRARAQSFADSLGGRISQLQKPLLSDADVANQTALASNSLLANRDAALKNMREKRYASGFEPTSGLLAGDERQIGEDYNNRQATIDATIRNAQIQGDEARRNEATRLQGLATQALQGGDVTALQEAAQSADLENQLYNIDQGRQREILTTANIPVDLTNMGFANASNAANAGGNPLSTILTALLPALNGQQGLQQGKSNSNFGSLAWLIQQALS